MRQLSIFDITVEREKTEPTSQENWVLIDGDNLLNRAFHATSHNIKLSPDGRPTNGVSHFLTMLLNFKSKYNATPLVFFDKGKGFRKILYPDYKEGRSEKPAMLIPQFPLIREVLSAGGIPYFWDDELEADDLIASACQTLNGHKYIISNDKDLLQLVRDDVTVVARKSKDDVEITPSKFREMYEGLLPVQITDLKAIAGDNSDNIKGVKGVGDTGAMKFVKHYGNVEEIAKATEFPSEFSRYAKKMAAGIDDMLFAKKLTTLVDNKSIQFNHYEVNKDGLSAICETLAMRSIIYLL